MNNYSSGNKPWKKKTLFSLKRKKHKSWLESAEYVPLALGDDCDSDDDEDDEITLHDIENFRVRQRGPTRSLSASNIEVETKQKNGEGSRSDPFLQCDLIPLELKNGDTLQGISVKYNCPISDLKRANNLISNQEFYALRNVKLPVKKHGLQSELLQVSQNTPPATIGDTTDTHNVTRTIHVGIGPLRSDSPQEAAEFLRKMDEDLVQIMLNTKTQKNSLEEAAATLSAPVIQPLFEDPVPKEKGLQFAHLMYCIIVLIVILPITVVIYMYHEHLLNPPNDINNTHISHDENHLTKPNILVER